MAFIPTSTLPMSFSTLPSSSSTTATTSPALSSISSAPAITLFSNLEFEKEKYIEDEWDDVLYCGEVNLRREDFTEESLKLVERWNLQCSICHLLFFNPVLIAKENCGHTFCDGCIRKLFEIDQNNSIESRNNDSIENRNSEFSGGNEGKIRNAVDDNFASSLVSSLHPILNLENRDAKDNKTTRSESKDEKLVENKDSKESKEREVNISLKTEIKCPLCKETVKITNLIKDQNISRIINGLTVKCKSRGECKQENRKLNNTDSECKINSSDGECKINSSDDIKLKSCDIMKNDNYYNYDDKYNNHDEIKTCTWIGELGTKASNYFKHISSCLRRGLWRHCGKRSK